MIDAQAALNTILLVAVGVFGWFARELWATIKELRTDLIVLRVEMAKNYVTKEEAKADLNEIKAMLDKIYSRLDNKADRGGNQRNPRV